MKKFFMILFFLFFSFQAFIFAANPTPRPAAPAVKPAKLSFIEKTVQTLYDFTWLTLRKLDLSS